MSRNVLLLFLWPHSLDIAAGDIIMASYRMKGWGTA